MLNEEFLHRALDKRREEQSFRQLAIAQNGVDFCSNDYLGLARTADVFTLAQEETEDRAHWHGSGGSRLLAGNYKYIEQAESDIAHFFGARCGLIFNSGYDANVGLFASVPQKGDTVIHDQLIHASIIDGIRLSHAQRLSFKHNDVADLEKKIKHAQGRVFVAVESVYSMDGDRAPLVEISALCAREGAHLIVDEAHATGVLGPDGAGLVKELQLETQCFARVYTFGKAVGCHGAIVAGSWALRDYLINFARSFIYTTALPASAIATVMKSLSLLRNMDMQREHLRQLVQYFRSKIPADRLTQSDTPIQAIITPGNQRVKLLALRLQAAGLDVRAVLHPTVAVGAERLRVVLHVFNTAAEIDRLSSIIAEEGSDTTAGEERAAAGA